LYFTDRDVVTTIRSAAAHRIGESEIILNWNKGSVNNRDKCNIL